MKQFSKDVQLIVEFLPCLSSSSVTKKNSEKSGYEWQSKTEAGGIVEGSKGHEYIVMELKAYGEVLSWCEIEDCSRIAGRTRV